MKEYEVNRMDPLRIYDSLSRRKQLFSPLHAPEVGLYVCGMTVYDDCHIGHARIFVLFDVVVRYLRMSGYKVNYVRNITDIDDKIIARAKRENRSIESVTETFIRRMHEDEASLGVLPPTNEPRATDHIKPMIAMIEQLLKKGLAYRASNGDVYYSVQTFKDYGRLVGQSLETLRAHGHVAVDSMKEHPLDFALWKAAKPDEPAWPSPFGAGRPGWHIECSAMSGQLLGASFDLHGGGVDLKFPHHQNEIAQSEGIFNKPLARHWMHVGHVQINAEKMSKSAGNFFTIRDLREQYTGEVLRYFLLASHYRHPLAYTLARLTDAQCVLKRFYLTLRHSAHVLNKAEAVDVTVQGKPVAAYVARHVKRFHAAMSDDFSVPKALGVLVDIAHAINRAINTIQVDTTRVKNLRHILLELGNVLGLLQQDPEAFLQTLPVAAATSSHKETLTDEAIAAMVAKREKVRAQKNWEEADRLRKELSDAGIVLEDTAEGSHWRRALTS